jgi:hypothetical protein
MDERDLALDKPTHENVVAIADRTRQCEDLVTLWMRPPVTLNGLSNDRLRQRWDRAFRRLQYYAVFLNKREGLACSHCELSNFYNLDVIRAGRFV